MNFPLKWQKRLSFAPYFCKGKTTIETMFNIMKNKAKNTKNSPVNAKATIINI
jgi:hypothetical protein